MNGTKVAEGTLPKIVPLQIWVGEAVEMGEDGGSAVHFTYTLPFKFTGAPSHRTRKAVDEESEAEERPGAAASPRCAGAASKVEVLVHDPVEDRVGSGARDVGSHGAGPSAFRAVPTATITTATAPRSCPSYREPATGCRPARWSYRRSPQRMGRPSIG